MYLDTVYRNPVYRDPINNRWRAVFRWTSSGPTDVDIRDYH
jgi:plasmid maintenance system killer protein